MRNNFRMDTTKISRSPALSCPTATCSRQSAPSSQNSRREDGPMRLPPGALELMSCDPLLGRWAVQQKTPRFVCKARLGHRLQLQRADAARRGPKKGRILYRIPYRIRTVIGILIMGGYFWPFSILAGGRFEPEPELFSS
jgi:hypothetical protein